MNQTPKDLVPKQQEDESMNFDDNYDEAEFLKQTENKKVQKLSIMDDFNELCKKFNHQPKQQTTPNQHQNTLAQYFANSKLKDQQTPQLQQTHKAKQQPQNIVNPEPSSTQNNKSSPQNPHHSRSESDNTTKTQNIISPFPAPKHERHPSHGQGFKKKTNHEADESKRNYSSVQDKKKILQPTKNPLYPHQNPPVKDYFGDQNNFVVKKTNCKNFINKEPKALKQSITNPKDSIATNTLPPKKQAQNPISKGQVVNKQNNLKESNLILSSKRQETFETQKNSKVTQKESAMQEKPRVIMYKTRIDLTLDTKEIIAMYKNQQLKSDYELSNSSLSSIDEGLFGNAIQKQRAMKTSQNVQSPNYNLLQPSYKQNISQKQYASSPINIAYTPNPTNMQKSLFQKNQPYR